MTACPYLLIEEQSSSPFPFPSVSHRCHATGTGAPIGQKEQRSYCLGQHYARCPFFPVQNRAAAELDTIPEAVAHEVAETPEEEPETIPESLPPDIETVPPVELEASLEPLPQEAETTPPVEPKATPEPLPPETAEAPPIETLPERTPEAEAGPESSPSGVGEVLPAEPAVEPVAEPGPAIDLDLAASEKKLRPAIRPEAAAPPRKRPTTRGARLDRVTLRPFPRPPVRPLIWAGVAVVCMLVLCIGALAIYGMAQLTSPSMLSFGFAELLPAILPILSIASFVVALILAALLLWARRRAA